MPVVAKTVGLLILSNIFMTFAWYAHLRHLSQRPWIVAALVSWGIALFEYLLQVPANRIGHTQLQLGQLKILQEVITLSVFVPFAALYRKDRVRLNICGRRCVCVAPCSLSSAVSMRLIFIHGPPAVGKLTVARELAELTGLPLFHNHLAVDVLTPVFEFGSPSFVKRRELIWLSVFQEAAKNDVSLIFTFA